MLSVEKPLSDPPSPCDDIPKLKHGSDESSSHELTLSEVDLPKPPLFDEDPLPKFSIRDYVFTARRKDIKTNWPFSLKNLQLCLNHGVKDLLPPFQPLDAVRNNQSFQRSCTVDDENIISNNIIDGEPSVPDDHELVVLDSSDETQPNEKLADLSAISCRSEGENDFPSTITTASISQSEIEESVPTNKPASSPVETEAAGPPLPHKSTESTTRTSGKKCRLIVKFSSQSDRSSTEDVASICTNISETMASKTCPVCKTFSSSSNTTLNAHIDQCLSMESTPKWTVDSKLTRHRIKPRKTRLMVDIYSTAPHCTLEDLDRRNGSSWASSVSSFPAHQYQDIEKSEMPAAEDKKQKVLAVHHDNDTVVDVGPVYIDSNGTKLRILSKFNEDAPSVSKVLEHLRPRKPLKGGKESKFLSTKKKKCRASKYHKYLKLASQGKKLLSSKVLSSQISRGQERYSGARECYGKGGRHVQKLVNRCNSGTLRQWVCSKRTGVAKKLNSKVCRQPVECKRRVPQDLLVENDESCFHKSLMDQNCDQEVENFSYKQISSPENSERMANGVFYEAQVNDPREQSPRRKRAGSPLSGAGIRGNVKGSLPQMKRKLRKNNTSSNDYYMLEPPKSAEICPTFLGNETVDLCAGPIDSSNFPSGVSIKQSRSCRSSRSKAMKFSSLTKNSLSGSSRVSVTESESTITNKCTMVDVDEDIVAQSSEEDQPYDFMHNYAGNQSGRDDDSTERSLSRNNVLEFRQKTGVLSISGRKETMVMKRSQVAPEFYQHDRGENIDLAVFVNKVDGHKEVQCSIDDIVTQSSSGIAVGETVSSMSKSMHPELKNLGDHSKTQANSLQYKGPEGEVLAGLTEPTFVVREETFCAGEVGTDMLVQNVHIGEELDSEVAQGSSFPEVDRIPIPGPPGSFLPSPRDMASEDFQGNSSLTTSRVQSSQDQHDFIDGDSSDSPVSATSTISNFTATRDEPKSSEPLPSVGPQFVQERGRSSLSGGSLDSSVENAALAPRTTSAAGERLAIDREKLKVNKKPLSFKSDDQPCCCQRKERASQGVTLSYEASQLLRRRAAASIMMPAMERQLSLDMNTRSNNSEVRSEIFCLSSCPTSKSQNVVLPVMKCPTNPSRDSADAGFKFSGRSDCDSISPSSSNSILRLMGKNLMVVNRDEDESMPLGQAQPPSQINHLTSQFPTFSGVFPSNIQNQVYHSFLPNMAQGSVILGQDPHNSEELCFDARFPINFRTHAGPKTPSMLSQGPGSLFSNQHMDGGGFMAPIEPCDYKSDYNIAAPQSKSKNRPTGAFANHMERVINIPDSQHKNAVSAATSNKEIIIIDDFPESEADNLTSEVVRHSGGLVGENHVDSSGTLIPNCNSSMSPIPFSCYPSPYDPPFQSEPPALSHSTNFHAVQPRRANASHARWSCTPEGSVVLQQRPFIAASSSTGHLRSALYNSPSLL